MCLPSLVPHSWRAACFAAVLLVGMSAASHSASRPVVPQSQDPIERANALLDDADAIAALAVIDEAVALGEPSTDAVALFRMKGYVEVILRRDEAAIASFRRVLELAPGDAFAALELAKRLHAAGRLQEARTRYVAFLRGEPEHADALRNLAALDELAERNAGLEKKIQGAHRRLYWLAGAAVLVLLSTLTVIRRLCR